MIQRQIKEDKLQLHCRPKQGTARVSDSLLSEEILECEFQKKFATLTFSYYSRMSDQFNTSGTFRTRWWSNPAMIRYCA